MRRLRKLSRPPAPVKTIFVHRNKILMVTQRNPRSTGVRWCSGGRSGIAVQHGGRRVIVKKYSNRRLYDTEGSCYITLEELADRIRRGAEPRVVDAKTNEDLTQATLTQIIIEGRGAARLLPVPL